MGNAVIDRSLHVEVMGELDLTVGDELEARVAPLLEPGARVMIGLRDVTFADSSGLGALLALAQRAWEAGAELALVDPAPVLENVIDRAGVRSVFHILDEAGAALR